VLEGFSWQASAEIRVKYGTNSLTQKEVNHSCPDHDFQKWILPGNFRIMDAPPATQFYGVNQAEPMENDANIKKG
jgi:hypothetical protein